MTESLLHMLSTDSHKDHLGDVEPGRMAARRAPWNIRRPGIVFQHIERDSPVWLMKLPE